MESKLKKALERLNKIIKNIQEKVKNNHSFIYIFVVVSIVIGYGFFFNSNTIVKEDGADYTTELFEIKKLENTNVELRARKYCKSSSMVEFYIYADDTLTLSTNTLDFELKEKSNPSENIPVDIRRLDKNNYLIRAEVPKKWSVLSLGVKSFNPLEISKVELETDDKKQDSEDENIIKNTSASAIKFYSEYEDMNIVSNLEMKKTEEYLIEFIDLDIESINKKIVKINKTKQEKINNIDAYNENIIRLEEEKAYQTDTEKEQTNTKISSIQTLIKSEEDSIDSLNKENKELKEKIRKLEEKKRDMLNEN